MDFLPFYEINIIEIVVLGLLIYIYISLFYMFSSWWSIKHQEQVLHPAVKVIANSIQAR